VPSEEIIIADRSPLIGLARIGHLSLLPRLARRIVTPNAAWAEVASARAAGRRRPIPEFEAPYH